MILTIVDKVLGKNLLPSKIFWAATTMSLIIFWTFEILTAIFSVLLL